MRIDRTTLSRLPPVDAAAQLGAAVQLGDLAVEAALDLAKDLRFPEEIQAALARAIAPPPGASAASLRAGFFLPVPGKDYRIDLQLPDQTRHAFDLRFGARIARLMLSEGLKIDRATGQILDAAGRPDPRCSVSTARRIFSELTGREAPPWIFVHPEAGSFYWPKQHLELELAGHLIAPRSTAGSRFLFRHRFDDFVHSARLWTRPELEPLERWKPERVFANGVIFESENPLALERARVLFDRIVGPSADHWLARERVLLEESKQLRAMLAPPKPAIEEVKKRVGGSRSEPWTIDDARETLRARLDQLARVLAPVKIVVVPAHKHYSAMPHVAHIQRVLRQKKRLGEAAAIVMQDPATQSYQRLLLISEDDLLGHARDVKHEFYHLLEDRYLPEATLRQIDQLWLHTVRKNGPFSRSDGMQREEFFSTLSEEFEGAHGEDGRRWLRQHHAELWEIFENVTRHLCH